MKVVFLLYLNIGNMPIILETESSSLQKWWEGSAEDRWLWICKVAYLFLYNSFLRPQKWWKAHNFQLFQKYYFIFMRLNILFKTFGESIC
jgi:hypothetical protein